MKQFSFVLSLAALALPAIVYGKMSINGWTGPDGQGEGANKLIYEREMCFNLDDPNIVGAGNPAVFHKLRSTIAQGDVPVDAWLYRGRDCHDNDPLYVDDTSGWPNFDPPRSYESAKLMER